MKDKRVFVTHIPHRKEGGAFVPALNISPAGEFGDIVEMFPPRISVFNSHEIGKQLEEYFKDFDCDSDAILPLGDPVLCAQACGILGRKLGYFDVLRWDRGIGRYVKSRVVI